MHDADYRRQLEQRKQASTLQLLYKAARLLNERSVDRVRLRHPEVPLRAAHTALFPHIDLEGTRITEIASRMGITKQAVGQLVDDLQAVGMVERVPDPSDGRAKLVCFTAAGRAALLDGLAVLGELEAELATEIGSARMAALHEALAALLAVVEAEEADAS